MICRFRGHFEAPIKEHLSTAARQYEQVHGDAVGTDDGPTPRWAFVHFSTPYQGSSYWGVRVENGYMVKAQTAEGLVRALHAARDDDLRRRGSSTRPASRSAHRSPRGADVRRREGATSS